MKRGTAKAVKLGMKMLKWLEENDDRSEKNFRTAHALQIRSGKDSDVVVTGWMKSHRTANKFKKAFQELSKLERSSSGPELSYKGNAHMLGIPLEVRIYGVTVLPRNCKVEESKVWHDEVKFPAGFRTEKKVVCNSDRESQTIET